jgi:hypothetical protein
MGDRNISVGGNVTGSILSAGDNSTIRATIKVKLPDPASVDIGRELAALREMFLGLETADRPKVANALDDAQSELAKPAPDKDEVGQALERAVRYATKAADFTDKSGQVAAHLAAAVTWLGGSWHQILGLAGLVT